MAVPGKVQFEWVSVDALVPAEPALQVIVTKVFPVLFVAVIFNFLEAAAGTMVKAANFCFF